MDFIVGRYKNYKVILKVISKVLMERGGSVVECLTQDRGVEGSSLTGGTVLCP